MSTVPKTVGELRRVARRIVDPRKVPPELRQKYEELQNWSDPTDGLVFIPDEVSAFCRIVRDPNIIHSGDNPVVPAFQILSSLAGYLDGKPPVFIPGYQTLIRHIESDFERFVRTGVPVSLMFKATELEPTELGPNLYCDLLIVAGPKNLPIIEGKIVFQFVDDRRYSIILSRAVSKTEAQPP